MRRARAWARKLECRSHFECKVEWTKEWCGRVMIVGKVSAVSVDSDCVDEDCNVIWSRLKPAHYGGAPYKSVFVGAYETMDVALPYEGPEVELGELSHKRMFREI